MPSRADRNRIYLIGLSRQRLRYERVLRVSPTLALKLIKILKCRLIAPQQIQSHRYRYRYVCELIETRENFTVAVRGQCQLVSAKSLNAHLSKREVGERGGRERGEDTKLPEINYRTRGTGCAIVMVMGSRTFRYF